MQRGTHIGYNWLSRYPYVVRNKGAPRVDGQMVDSV
jgi:hypothetical protein